MDGIYEAFTDDHPFFIYGYDFMALNYGKEFSYQYQGGNRVIRISGQKKSYWTMFPEQNFPEGTFFHTSRPKISLIDKDLVLEAKEMTAACTLDELVVFLRKKGMWLPD